MTEDMDLLMVTVSGKDGPGITAALSRIIFERGAEVVDIEQASLQDLLGLTILLDLKGVSGSQDGLIKDLLFEASRSDLTLNFRLYSEEKLRDLSNRQLYILTFFGGTQALAELSAILGEESVNIEMISSLTKHGPKCIEMMLNTSQVKSISKLKERIMTQGHLLNTDLAFQKLETNRKSKRLIVFDMDSTLIDMEVIDELARLAGVYHEVARITEKAMRGELDFEESITQRVAMLKGLTLEDITRVRDGMVLSEGVHELTITLKVLGYKLGVVTGGFDFFANHLKEKLNLDFACANQLEIKNGILTGRLIGPIVDASMKARVLNQVARQEGILLDQTVAVGDGANDALMLGQAGLGLSYNAKSKLDRVAHSSIGRTRLLNILYLLGISEEDIVEALKYGNATEAGRRPQPQQP